MWAVLSRLSGGLDVVASSSFVSPAKGLVSLGASQQWVLSRTTRRPDGYFLVTSLNSGRFVSSFPSGIIFVVFVLSRLRDSSFAPPARVYRLCSITFFGEVSCVSNSVRSSLSVGSDRSPITVTEPTLHTSREPPFSL